MDNVELDMDVASLPKQKWVGDEHLVQFGGFWFVPQHMKLIKRVINHFTPLPTDVILATSPKTGTTWLKSLLYSILNRSFKHKLAVQHPHQLVPFLEGPPDSDELSFPTASLDTCRLFSTHISYQLLAKTLDSCECRVVYLTRNPKDTLVSLWHFMKKRRANQPWTIDEAADAFCRGVTPYGPYYDHVIGYRALSLKRPENVMFVNYEEMKEDPHGHVKKLGDFLGCPFQEEDEVKEIVKNCSFEVQSSYEVNKSEQSLIKNLFPYNSFFRKGKTGDHVNYLSNELIQRIDTLTKQRFHSLDFMYGI
ncbi:cytosolic sulfotransferase 12-like [Salvia miltiorrhiza]|uniref:cytosolic sulfotransferase 12-like n=1 Tax=Salvia miltiorrhiza TaxID=226208 RepID=UPI0025ACEDDC|nr:cytosolic sulfotransferase 12-like [Salvia miltiorrhiza]